MILHVYTIYDKKLKIFLPYQMTKDSPDLLIEVYERQAVKNIDDISKYRDMVLKHVGIFDDNNGVITYDKFNDVVDFDSLILSVKELNNG